MKMLFSGDDEQFQPKSLYIEVLKKNNLITITRSIFCKRHITAATPLFVALVVIEVMDVVLLLTVFLQY
jgi:tellurite resistance protein TerC